MASYNPVAAVLRGLDVLQAVNAHDPADLKTIHAATGHDKATIIRMLETLIHAGYVVQDPESGTYLVTGRTLQLSAGYDRSRQFELLLAPALKAFRTEVGWPSDFATLDGTEMIVVETSRDTGPMSFNRRRGFRAPVLRTSIGRAYLAFCPEAEREELIEALRQRAEAGGPAVPTDAEIGALLEQVRAAGYATMDEGYSSDEYNGSFWAVAVPVMAGDRIWGALNLMMLKQATTPERVREELLPKLKAAADGLAAAFAEAGV
ncbi:IclR family transcriptional regulator C-terminal domain-containing protein [Maritimibacter alkaliphilus]|uniref:IclR family transcriptional regulator domain-containing protein n=1 Tax=Maritimibacter alkaliphilus TaxID=404236 RepID=UPI001C96A1F8|nr:IclR family transcriptional regulator C-terminal domain-containing protein [Maritimibacter alkaliphilus]MBY6092341.1 helix-turn-helix domain-containing protein [Maritimibacter alkaliphilus]